MAVFKLATAADDIRIWDCNGYTLIKQYNPHSTNVSSLAWSQDNNFIASACTVGDNVSVTYIKNNTHTITDLAAGEDRTCVAFNSNSRYLLCGGKTSTLAIWDLKTQKLKKQYKDHSSAITSLTFNWNDTYIASGADNGNILLHNVVTAHGSQPMTAQETQAIRQLQYSHFRKALLGAASDDGVVNLWDTNTRRQIHSFTQMHCASVTGLSFSPLNEMLLMSVGLDKRIICYDVVGKTGVKTITADEPLSSIDIHPDGATLAIGTMKGKVLIYDLRYGVTPLQTINAHKSDVQTVKFMNSLPTSKDDSTMKSKYTRLNQIRKLHSTNTSPKSFLNGEQHTDIPNAKGLTDRTNIDYSLINRSTEKSGETEIISPCKDVTSATKNWDTSASENNPDPMSNGLVDEMGVFSPLATNGSTGGVSSYADMSRSSLHDSQSPRLLPRAKSRTSASGSYTNHTTNSTTDTDSQTSIDVNHGTRFSPDKILERHKNASPRGTSTPISEITGKLAKTPLSSQPTKYGPSTESMEAVPLTNATSLPHRTVLPARHVQREITNKNTDWRVVSDVPKGPSENDIKRPIKSPRSDRGYESSLERGDSNGNTIVYTGATDTGVTAVLNDSTETRKPRTFQMDMIQSIIHESMEEFEDEMRRDIMKLHVEMLRQFQIQKAELLEIVSSHSVNGELLAEIHRLREENKRLKKTF